MAANTRRNASANPNVSFIRPELKSLLSEYEVIRDCIAGEVVIKAAGRKYLPMPDAHDQSPENIARYACYKDRAVFYNVTRRTLMGLVGQVFARDPVMKIPPVLEPMVKNVTGTGISLLQSAELSLGHVVAYSRGGVFVDFPDTTPTNGASTEDVATGRVRPTIYAYSPLEILNWRVVENSSEEKLSLVVLAEGHPISDDGFEVKITPQIRVLKLDAAGNYIQEIWRDPLAPVAKENEMPTGNFKLVETIKPTGADGLPMKEIPFMFIGSQNNDVNPERPNMYDMASLNIAHYRNSADYEESCYVVGQPTPVATGLTTEWVEKVLKGKLSFGSRGGIPLPSGATAELLQAVPNTMIKEAMTDKVEQMRSLGAKIVEVQTKQRTATETKSDNAASTSVLTSCANNVSAAYIWALELSAKLLGVTAPVEFSLNIDFDVANMTPEEVKTAIDAWQKGAITFPEMRTELRRYGLATEDDKAAQAAIQKEQVAAMELAAAHDPQFNEPAPAAV